MKKFVIFLLIVMLTAILSGCIISKSPDMASVSVLRGSQQTFKVGILPPGASYVWTLDGEDLTNTTETYQYTPSGGSHVLTVAATQLFGTDTQTWNIVDLEASQIINSAGGAIAVTDTASPIVGTHADIPAGALTSDTAITIMQAATPSGLSGHPAWPCVEFGPSGTQFAGLVDLYLPYNDEDNDGLVDGTTVTEDRVKAGYFNETTLSWEEILVIDRDPAANLIHIQVSHFSKYIAFLSYDPITLISPLDNSTEPCSNLIDFSWEPGEFHSITLQYWISISEDSDPEDIPILVDQFVGPGTTFQYGLEYGKRYLWKVTARENALEEPVSESPWWSFTVVTIGSIDSDCDGLIDVTELLLGTNPLDADTDDDGIMDGQEDANQNGIVDLWETNPTNIDTDGDGIYDGIELGVTVAGPGTDPGIFLPDLDPATTTNPLSSDTDHDGIPDGVEDPNHNGHVDPGELDPNVPDYPPVAEAGSAQTILAGATVTLDGSGSTDLGNNISSYHWQQTDGPDVVLSNANAVSTQFTAPDVLSDTELTFELRVTDSGGLSSTDTCIITVQPNVPPNLPPVAVALVSGSLNGIYTLNGSESTDPENNIASYHWQQTSGPDGVISNANASVTQFDPPVISSSTQFSFELTVTDIGGLQATATCSITINVSNFSQPINDLLNSMVSIPGGTFMMGSTYDIYRQAQYTTPVHAVTLQAFEIGKYEVTQAQYQAVMGVNPSFFQALNGYPGSDDRPVGTDWSGAQAFCTALSSMTGRTFTLPSEAQWEYACRAGSTTLYSYGDSDALLGDYGWYSANNGAQIQTVGTKLPNNWGLYDMMGNASEFCLDSWHTNYVGAPTDGSAWEPETGSVRVIRDGHFFVGSAWTHQSAFRTDMPSVGTGFRVVEIP